jgi:hypothetical protein
MKAIFPLLAALSLTLAGTSAVFADDNLDPPDVLQKNQGPGNIDTTAPVLNKKKPSLSAPVPTASPVPKAPEKKKLGY